MRIKLPDRNDALVLVGALLVTVSLWQVAAWIGGLFAGVAAIYVGVVTQRPPGPPDQGE